MNLYLIKQSVNNGFDTFDSVIVCSNNEDSAKQFTQNGGNFYSESDWTYEDFVERDWATIEHLSCELIGVSIIEEERIVLASYNAG